MTADQVMADLKTRRLPTFGTAAERKDRLKKFHGKWLQVNQTQVAADFNFARHLSYCVLTGIQPSSSSSGY